MRHKVIIAGMAMDSDSNTPIILLRTEDGDQTIPIWIGLLEATAIASALQAISFDRPMTHDLFRNFLHQMDVRVERVDICDLRENTFYAEIHLVKKDGVFTMDARPSDAIALALRFDAPIFVDDRVMAQSGPGRTDGQIVDDSEEGKKWAEYLESLDPEDFGKYTV